MIHTSALILNVVPLECPIRGSSYRYLLEMRLVTLISFFLDVKLNGLSKKKTADTLVADNPIGFNPDELTRLLEKIFTWSVSFTDSTTDSHKITF